MVFNAVPCIGWLCYGDPAVIPAKFCGEQYFAIKHVNFGNFRWVSDSISTQSAPIVGVTSEGNLLEISMCSDRFKGEISAGTIPLHVACQ